MIQPFKNGPSWLDFRYTDHALIPQEEFISFSSVKESTWDRLANMALDVLCRLNSILSYVSRQMMMLDKYPCAQVLIRQEMPLAVYVYSGVP